MAKFNEILVGRYNRGLQKLFQMKGGPPAGQLATEIGVQLQIFSGVENRYLESWNRFSANAAAPAIAAARAGVQIRNPLNSGIIVVMERIGFITNTVGGVAISQAVNPTDLTNTFAGFRMDSRIGQASAVILSGTAAVATTDLGAIVMVLQEDVANHEIPIVLTDNQEWTLLPGDTLRFVPQTVNVTASVNIMWRERALEESEFK